MINERERLEQARARLAQKRLTRRREDSVIELVEALKVEIQAARAEGKTWREITSDIAGGESIKTDSVRLAFSRLQACAPKTDAVPRGKRRRAEPASEVHADPAAVAQVIHSPTEAPDAGLFAPMFDAQDTRGRSLEGQA